MERKSLIQNLTIMVLGIAIVVMAVGYANYSAKLEINGDATATAAKWDVHFANITKTKDITGATATINSSNNKLVEFDVSLKPGEEFAFTVNVVNDGTFAAKLTGITPSGSMSEKDGENWKAATTLNDMAYDSSTGKLYSNKYLEYSVTYSDGTKLALNDALAKKGSTGDSKTLLVSVKYNQPTEFGDLPSVDTKYHFELDLDYDQA